MSAVLDARIAPTDDSTASADLELRQLMQGGSRTFFAASLLLPARIRAQATALYAFCRIADDEIDFGLDKPAALDALRKRLDGIYGGRPIDCAADRALCRVVQDTGLPRALLDGLLEGFLWDAEERQYETLAEVQAYGARVAGTVGAMMAIVMQTRSPDALARACELGVAMQLTNIARDVGEDARAGRLYLPRQWLREAGIDPEAWLRAPVFNAAIASVTGRLLDAADELYRRADAGIAALPRDCRGDPCRADRLCRDWRAVAPTGPRFDSSSRRGVRSTQAGPGRPCECGVVQGPAGPDSRTRPLAGCGLAGRCRARLASRVGLPEHGRGPGAGALLRREDALGHRPLGPTGRTGPAAPLTAWTCLRSRSRKS